MIPPPPRRLGFDALWQSLTVRPLLLIVGLMFGLVGTIQFVFFMFVFQSLTGPDLTGVRTRGIETRGEVVGIEPDRSTSINGIHPYRVDFSYEVNGDKRFGSISTMERRTVLGWQPGTPVTVKYLDEQAILTDVPPFEFPLIIKFIPLLFVPFDLIGLVCLIVALWAAFRKYKLLKYGEVSQAEFRAAEGWMLFGGRFPQNLQLLRSNGHLYDVPKSVQTPRDNHLCLS